MSNESERQFARTRPRNPARFRARIIPHSLAARAILALLAALIVVQALGLLMHGIDRMVLQREAEERQDEISSIGLRIASVYRASLSHPAELQAAIASVLPPGANVGASLGAAPAFDPDALPHFPLEHVIHDMLRQTTMPEALRPRGVILRLDPPQHRLLVAMHEPDGSWLSFGLILPPPLHHHAGGWLLLVLFGVVTAIAAALIIWSVQRLTQPIRMLAAAAETLGRDVNAPALPEDGPSELAAAAAAFNTMAGRIRRFVQDRTLLLAAIGHDLRTPITRLKLRAEFIEDDEMRGKFLSDLDELETMVSATLAFGRDTASREPMVPLDLPELLQTILNEAGDARPDAAPDLIYHGPEHLTVQAKPVALKRALGNLIGNAVKYGGDAVVTLEAVPDGMMRIAVEDSGPGIPPDELGQVFEPFYRVERSRNRETGGTGLGLPIARNILRAHGGDVVLANRGEGGLRATITLPA